MTTKSSEELGFIQTNDEKAAAIATGLAEATADRLKMKFSETRKTGATENPEAGCVAWYRFPQAGS